MKGNAWYRPVLLSTVAVLTTAILRPFGTRALDEDGPGFLITVAHADGPILYHHVGYLEMGRLLAEAIGGGAALDALLWVSAACGGAALALTLAALWRVLPLSRAALLASCLGASPALWLHATRVELHSAQMLGAAALLGAATAAVGRAPWQRAALLFGSALVALPMHATNLLLVPGAMWIASRREHARLAIEPRAAGFAAIGATLGVVCGAAINRRARGGGAGLTGQAEEAEVLLTRFWAGPSFGFLESELLLAWYPVLAVAVVVFAVSGRGTMAALPHVAAAAPGLLFFTIFGVRTGGGYFTSSMVALTLAAGAAVSGRAHTSTRASGAAMEALPLEGRRLALVGIAVAIVASIGLVHSVRAVRSPERAALEAMADARFATIVDLLPDGGWVVGVQPHRQVGDGRDSRWIDFDLSETLTGAMHAGLPAEDFAARYEPIIVDYASRGLVCAIDQSWRDFAQHVPGLEDYMTALTNAVSRHYVLEPIEHESGPHLLGRAR